MNATTPPVTEAVLDDGSRVTAGPIAMPPFESEGFFERAEPSEDDLRALDKSKEKDDFLAEKGQLEDLREALSAIHAKTQPDVIGSIIVDPDGIDALVRVPLADGSSRTERVSVPATVLNDDGVRDFVDTLDTLRAIALQGREYAHETGNAYKIVPLARD